MSALKDSASFPHFLSTGQSKYVASHFVVQEPGTVQLLLPSLSPLLPTDTHTVIHQLCISACVRSRFAHA